MVDLQLYSSYRRDRLIIFGDGPLGECISGPEEIGGYGNRRQPEKARSCRERPFRRVGVMIPAPLHAERICVELIRCREMGNRVDPANVGFRIPYHRLTVD